MKVFPFILSGVLIFSSFDAFAFTFPKKKDKPVSVCVGGKKTISLKANPASGYLWQTSLNSEQKEFVKIYEQPYEIPTDSRLGGQGKSVFDLSFIKQGNVSVTFRYFRPWEQFNPEKDIEKTFSYKIKECD